MSKDGTDGIANADGTVGEANSTGSNQASGEQGSIAVTETAKQIADLQKKIDDLTRTLQSSKDKAVANTNKRIDGLERDMKAVLREALSKGQSVQDVLGEIEDAEERDTKETLRELARAYREGKPFGGDARGGASTTGVDVTNVLRELELDENDTRVQAFRSKSFASEAEAYREAARLLKSITSKQPSDADMPSVVAGTSKNADAQTRLQQEYEKRKEGLRGQALINLKMEMRKKGLRSVN